MADSGLVAAVQQIIDAASAVYDQMLSAYAADYLANALQPGGEIYEQLMNGAIAGAMAWYGMYTPLVYRRGMTMTDPGNISITGSVQASGSSISGSAHVANVSPHAGYSYGFDFYRRGRLFHRPGGDLMESVPSSVAINISIPQSVANAMFADAVKAVL